MSLRDELDAARREIKTDSYPITIRELSSLYRDQELDIHPEFQRFLRWTPEQKTRLIESILLGIPLPSIFVFQRADGVLDVVDGLQRISTILQFMGELKNENGEFLPCLTMGHAQYLPSIDGKMWKSEDGNIAIGEDIQKFFRQERIDIKILLRESDEKAKYELFQRINTGGTPLSAQEVRNCILIMINRDAYFWLENLSKEPDFTICCPIPDRLQDERYDIELVLRFIVFHDIDLEKISDISDLSVFLTSEMRARLSANMGELQPAASVFARTFAILGEACGENALRRFDATKSKFLGPFLISAFEMIALGVAHNIDFVAEHGNEWLEGKIKNLWSDTRIEGVYGQGVSAARRIPRTIDFGRCYFAEA